MYLHCCRNISLGWAGGESKSTTEQDFSEICIKCGLRASVRYRRYSEGKMLTPKMKALGFIHMGGNYYDVSIAWKNNEPYIHSKPERLNYCGMVGCVTVSNGLLIVRRNGIPVVSGNSHEQYYQAIRRCHRFGQKRQVNVHIVTTEGEQLVVEAMIRKERQAVEMYDGIVREMGKAINEIQQWEGKPMTLPTWLGKKSRQTSTLSI